MTGKHSMATRLLLAAAAAVALTCTLSLRTLWRQGNDARGAWAASAGVKVTAERLAVEGVVHGRVLVNEKVVMDKMAPVGQESGYQRAEAVAKQLQDAADRNVDPAIIKAAKDGLQDALYLGEAWLAAVTPEDATANETTTEALAKLWAAQIGNAFYAAGLGGSRPTAERPPVPSGKVVITAQRVPLGTAEVADVLINGTAVIKIRRGQGNQTAYQVASTIVERLRKRVEEGYGPRDMRGEQRDGQAVVVAGEHVLATVDQYHAQVNNSTPIALARTWADNISGALSAAGVESSIRPQPPAGPEAARNDAWYAEHYRDKWVPILSIPDGIRIGAARVNGAVSDVKRVVAVAQLETPWEDFLEIDIYVPITTKTPGKFLDRVQGVGVTALADFNLTWEGKPSKGTKAWSIFKRPKRKADQPRFEW